MTGWAEHNQRHLMNALGSVRALVGGVAAAPAAQPWPGDLPPPALDRVCVAFGLSPFERDVLLLCAGPELDGDFPATPTFGLALARLPDPHWSALTPSAPLRYWRLVEPEPGQPLATARLRIDERILHELAGVSELDSRLAVLLEPPGVPADSVPSQQALADRVVRQWQGAPQTVVQLCGGPPDARTAVATLAALAAGLELATIPAHLLPATPSEVDSCARLWEREAALGGLLLMLDCTDLDRADSVRVRTVVRRLAAPILIASADPVALPGIPTVRIDVAAPTVAERGTLWRSFLASDTVTDHQVDSLAAQFALSPNDIAAAAAGAADFAGAWDASRTNARPGLDELAQRVESQAGWDDLVLPAEHLATLHEIGAHVRHRGTVYDRWGFAARNGRGLGITALFAGPSGTGKTLAAEVLAGELRLDLYRIDLATVVSKYIGETEKNLRHIFDAAEGSGVILLFDEADALFGRRSEVKDSHDRYANIEVSYLLQRMEAYRGLAILTTNLRSAIDTAFLRRLRFVVEFPFPDSALRAEIWRRAFPCSTPVEGLDPAVLARMNITGGTIHNIAVRAAFLAAAADVPVGTAVVGRAARGEYAKLDRAPTEAELGWAR